MDGPLPRPGDHVMHVESQPAGRWRTRCARPAPSLEMAETVVARALGHVFPAAQIEVRQHGRVLLSQAYGWLDPETRQRPTRLDTLFDLASVTKLFVVTAFMTLVEEGKVELDQPVCTTLPDFRGVRPIRPYEDPLQPGALVTVEVGPAEQPDEADAGRVTFRNLLIHNAGLPAWRPLYREGDPDAARRLALTTYFSYPTGARVVYSDIGLILVGMAVERLTGLRLDEAVARRVTRPLEISGISYFDCRQEQAAAGTGHTPAHRGSLPDPQSLNVAPTEYCAWRGRRIVGEVHDENACSLGGIAGHAGLFATAHDLATFGQSFLDALQTGETASGASAHRRIDESGEQQATRSTEDPTRPILRRATVAEMTCLQAQDGAIRRGLGFALWSPDPEASGNPFSQAAFGHTGFTGTSLWMDPARDLVVASLTNRVYYGRDGRGIAAFRVALHRAIVEAIDESGDGIPGSRDA